MNEEAQFKLQAHLDGELPAGEAAEVEQWLARDPEARALLSELKNTNAALAGHEAEARLPETREFFWSKIEREIGRQSVATATATEPARKSFWARWGWRGLAPAGGLAAACLFALHLANPGTASAEFVPELELASDDMGAYTFRNQEDGLTTIWLYDRTSQTQSAQLPTSTTLASK
jgi:anti-sigma factor RsiW